MRNGWQTKKLGDLLEVQNGYAFDSKAFGPSEGVPLIRIRDLKGGKETETRFAGDYDTKYLVTRGDLLIGMDGEFGCYEWQGDPALLNQRVCRLQGFTSALLPRFLSYGVNSHLKAIEDVTGYATVKHLSSKQILNIAFPLPPIPEQRRIVSILDEAFDGIATAKANAEKNLHNARSLFESQLQAVFTERGEGWVQKRLPDIARDFGRGKSKHRPRNAPKLYGGQYPFVQTGDISNANHFITSYSQTYSEVGLAQSKLWPKGTVGIAIVGATVGETAILGFDACFPDSVIAIVANEHVADYEYVEYLLQSFKALLKEKGKGTARDNINLGTFENQTFPFPTLEVQKKIVSTLNRLNSETQCLESIYQQKLDALDELKKSLLHQAFVGEL
jgi:type I restriction enzyme S subunit